MGVQTNNEPVPGLRAADWLVRLVLPAYLISGAAMKFLTGSPSSLPVLIRKLDGSGLPLNQLLLFLVVVCIELTLGFFLLLHRRWAWPLGVIVLIALTGVAAHQTFSGEATCGCFGSFFVPSWATLAIDAALLVLAMVLPRAKWPADISSARWVAIMLTTAGALALVYFAHQSGYQGKFSSRYIARAETWQGRKWDALDIFDRLPMAPDSRVFSPATFPEDDQVWVFYRRTCPHCDVAIRELLGETLTGKRRVVLVDLPYPKGFEEANGMTPFPIDCPDCEKLRALDGIEYDVRVPMIIRFNRGIVVGITLGT